MPFTSPKFEDKLPPGGGGRFAMFMCEDDKKINGKNKLHKYINNRYYIAKGWNQHFHNMP